jgi:hypothetical protein
MKGHTMKIPNITRQAAVAVVGLGLATLAVAHGTANAATLDHDKVEIQGQGIDSGDSLWAGAAQATSARTMTGHHCFVVLPANTVLRCFDTVEEADKFALQLGPSRPSKGEQSASTAARSAGLAAQVNLTHIGTEYTGAFWTGDSIRVYGSNGPCTTPVTNVDYQLPDWSVVGFNQKISSFQTFGNCWAKHYDLVNFGGLAVGYQGSQLVINAALDNDTSSERWS